MVVLEIQRYFFVFVSVADVTTVVNSDPRALLYLGQMNKQEGCVGNKGLGNNGLGRKRTTSSFIKVI